MRTLFLCPSMPENVDKEGRADFERSRECVRTLVLCPSTPENVDEDGCADFERSHCAVLACHCTCENSLSSMKIPNLDDTESSILV